MEVNKKEWQLEATILNYYENSVTKMIYQSSENAYDNGSVLWDSCV